MGDALVPAPGWVFGDARGGLLLRRGGMKRAGKEEENRAKTPDIVKNPSVRKVPWIICTPSVSGLI